MEDLKRLRIAGKAVGVDGNDIDTDRIFPARHMLCVTFEGLGRHVFGDDRRQAHPFDDPARADARVLLVDRNFGCGSSREHAPQALMRWNKGIAAVVGESFAEIFFGNCVAIGIPCVTAAPEDLRALKSAAAADAGLDVLVDLESMQARAGALTIPVAMPDGPRRQFLTGRWDSTQELLEGKTLVAEMARTLPFFGTNVETQPCP
jgi:3-isopropylmalate/(R)-2-methylmalate dehydratase small subunit